VQVRFGELRNGRYFVEDDGPGIDGGSEEIAKLFSVARPMVSSGLLRRPTRVLSAMARAWSPGGARLERSRSPPSPVNAGLIRTFH
jgi:hypothetical protein